MVYHIEALWLAVVGQILVQMGGLGLAGRIIDRRLLLHQLLVDLVVTDGGELLIICLILPWLGPGWDVPDVKQLIQVVGVS